MASSPPGQRRVADWLLRRAENVAVILLAVMFVAFIAQIVFRYLLNLPTGWTSELTVICWLWLILWGAAFEDLVATDLPDGRNIADDYLRRRGWKESASTREYIAGLRRSVISLHEVGGLVPGRSMQLRDLVRGGEPVRVSEKRGSEGLRQWDRIATRVAPLRGGAVVSGTLMLFEHEAGEATEDEVAQVARRDVGDGEDAECSHARLHADPRSRYSRSHSSAIISVHRRSPCTRRRQ